MGIEPTALAWEARVLPLYDARDLVQCIHLSHYPATFNENPAELSYIWRVFPFHKWGLINEITPQI